MSDASPASAAPAPRRWPLHTKILIGLVVGATLGVLVNLLAAKGILDVILAGLGVQRFSGEEAVNFAVGIADPIGRIFLRLILMVVIPLVVAALALGVL